MDALFNGRKPDGALAASRGLHYGDGVFRTLLLHGGQLVDWDAQMIKLAADCERLALRMPPAALLRAELLELAQGRSSAALKIVLTRQSAGRGYAPQGVDCDRLLQCHALPDHPQECWTRGIETFRSPVRLSAQPLLAGIKHLNRLEQVLASRDWPQGAREGIMCDGEGRPVCGTRSNLFWVRDGALHTPALDRCGVAGMMRGRLLELARQLGIEVRVAAMDWAGLEMAEEVLVSNSLIGLWPVHTLEDRSYAAPGALTLRLMRALNHPRTVR